MNEEDRTVPSPSPEELDALPQGDMGESESSRYRFIIYCGLEKEGTEEN